MSDEAESLQALFLVVELRTIDSYFQMGDSRHDTKSRHAVLRQEKVTTQPRTLENITVCIDSGPLANLKVGQQVRVALTPIPVPAPDGMKLVELPGGGRVLCPSCVDRIERLASGQLWVYGTVEVDGKAVSVSTEGDEELLRYSSPVVADMLRKDLELGVEKSPS